MDGDVLGQVTAAFQLGEDTQDYQQAAIASRIFNVRTNQFVEDVLLDVAMEGIDELFADHQSPGGIAVRAEEELGGAVQSLPDQGKHLQHGRVQRSRPITVARAHGLGPGRYRHHASPPMRAREPPGG